MAYRKIKDVAAQFGTENLRFFMPARRRRTIVGMISYTLDRDPEEIVECRADEKLLPNRRIIEGYKMTLVPLDQNYAYEDFYQCDFESLHKDSPERYYVKVGDETLKLGRYDD